MLRTSGKLTKKTTRLILRAIHQYIRLTTPTTVIV